MMVLLRAALLLRVMVLLNEDRSVATSGAAAE